MQGISKSNETGDSKDNFNYFDEGGEIAKYILSYDWSVTRLGNIVQWPQILKNLIKAILQNPLPAVLLWGNEGITFYNDAFIYIAGNNHPSLLGLMDEKSDHKIHQIFKNALSNCLNGKFFSIRNQIFPKDNGGHSETLSLEMQCSPLFSDDGKAFGGLINVTELTKYNTNLNDLDAKVSGFNQILNFSEEGIWHYDAVADIGLWNESMYEITGYPKNQIIKNDIEILLPFIEKNERAKLLEAENQLLKNAAIYRTPISIRNNGGQKLHLQGQGFPHYNNNGNVIGFTRVFKDISEIKSLEESLKESEERFTSMADASGLLIALINEEGVPFYYNKKWLALTGKTLDSLLSEGWVDLFHPEDRSLFIAEYRKAFDSKEILKSEFRLRTSSNEYIWLLAIASPRFNANGKFAGYISSCIDITERKVTEKALKESEQRFKLMADASPNFVWTFGIKGNLTYINTHGLSILGASMEELIQGNWTSYIHPEDRKVTIELLQKTLKSKSYFRHEHRIVTRTNEVRWLLSSASPSFLPDGELYGFVGSSIDITERKETEVDLKQFKLMSDHAFDAFILLAEDGSFKYLNDLALKRWGYTREEAENITVADVDPGYTIDGYRNIFNVVIRQGAIPTFETIHVKKDGTRFPVEVNLIGITLRGKPYMFGVARDISERKIADEMLQFRNEQLQKTNTDLDNFIYTASHDLKAPIANLEGLLNAFSAESNFHGESKVLLDMMFHSISRFKNTIKDLTEISKIQRIEPEDLKSLFFKDVIDEIFLDMGEILKQIKPEINLELKVPEIKYTHKNLRSIVYNLISNALKYNSPERPPVITISTYLENNFTVFQVSDNGLGLSIDNQKKIFGMFKRAHQHVEGTGVGLYIIKRMIENTGGRITVESEIGKGTTFKAYLPNKNL